MPVGEISGFRYEPCGDLNTEVPGTIITDPDTFLKC